MIQIETLQVGEHTVQGLRIVAPGGEGHPNMLVITCKNGYIMCGYLNTDTAKVVDDAAAVVGGACFEETLTNLVKEVTPAAAALGVEVGMTGAEAVAKLNA